jgi:putative colanic acid biosynthesis acetyltransferase WcaF
MAESNLASFNNSWYDPGAGSFRRFAWYMVNAALINSAFPVSGIKVRLLRMFGARVGKGVVIKPHVNIKYPWKLSIGDYAWIGEYAWIDNLGETSIGSHVCISQGALLLCGNHNYKSAAFDLIVGPIRLENGVWIGAKAVVCPGVTCGSHSVLSAGSVAAANLEPYKIYKGNPAIVIRSREIL